MITPSMVLSARILIVDDLPVNIRLLKAMLEHAGYLCVTSTTDPTSVSGLYLEHRYDLILLDLDMPKMDGFEVIEALKAIETDSYLSVLVISAEAHQKLRALQAGAKDFISKPFERPEILARIHNMLEVRLLHEEEKNRNSQLEELVQQRVAELRTSEKMFRDLAANIPEALWIRDTEQNTIAYVNPAWKKLIGLCPAPGEPIEKAYQTIHPDDLKWLSQERRKTSSTQLSSEYRLLLPDKAECWVHARTFSIMNPVGKTPLVVEIIEDVTQKREVQRQLLHLARHDALTKLPNRTLLYESLRKALTQADEDHLTASVLFLDIDFFKNVNDKFGHTVGDALLCEFALRLEKCVRPGDIVGRLGGDEFVVIILSPIGADGAAEIAKRIGKALQAPLEFDGRKMLVTMSIGIANYPADTCHLETLVRYADAAMYAAKVAGRDTYRCYTSEMTNRAIEKADIESSLQLALGRGEFLLHYQPKMEVESGKLTSVEALIRWNRPGHDIVLPGIFIPMLEEMDLIVPVGKWVIDTACRQIREWNDAGLGDIRVAVNVSSRQIHEERFVGEVAESLRQNGIDGHLLEFEITESTLMAQGEATNATLNQLKDLGITIAIDDFGTGYSSLAYLKRFPVDALKIDIAFIRDVTTNMDAATIAVAIINMAHSLRLKVTAEGVETGEQLDFLRNHNCDEVQGYFLSRPINVDELSAKFLRAPDHRTDANFGDRSLRARIYA